MRSVVDTPTPELKRKADQALARVGRDRQDIARYLDCLEDELCTVQAVLGPTLQLFYNLIPASGRAAEIYIDIRGWRAVVDEARAALATQPVREPRTVDSRPPADTDGERRRP